MNHLKLFDIHNTYKTFISSEDFKLPNVSYCILENEVHYNPDYPDRYLTLEPVEEASFTITIQSAVPTTDMKYIEYSLDDGNTWTRINNIEGEQVIHETPRSPKPLLLRGKNKRMSVGVRKENKSTMIKSNDSHIIYGNIMSLLYGSDFIGKTDISNSGNYTFGLLFIGNNGVINADNLILPTTKLAPYCYNSLLAQCENLESAKLELPALELAEGTYRTLFQGCKKLKTTVVLPAMSLKKSCYAGMYNGCSSLTQPCELPSTELAESCYEQMFVNTNIKIAPELPATTLAPYCYSWMFNGCKSLTKAPDLLATNITTGNGNRCYNRMFQGCTNLNYVKALFKETPSDEYTYLWLSGVSPTGTFVKNAEATWDVTGTSGIPEGWTIETINV